MRVCVILTYAVLTNWCKIHIAFFQKLLINKWLSIAYFML